MMQSYIVRLCDEGVPGEIVGIFCARSVEELSRMVDEVCRADDTEFAVLGPGGIIWTDGGAHLVPLEADERWRRATAEESMEETTEFDGCGFSSWWWEKVSYGKGLRWRRLSLPGCVAA